MFRRNAVTASVGLTVWLIGAVAWAAPTSSVAVSLTTPDASAHFAVISGQVDSVSASAQCANGNLETWTSVSVTSSTVDFGKGPRMSRVAAVADVVHVDCDGISSADSVSIRTNYDESGKVVRDRDPATGARILTVPITGTLTLPNDVLPGAVGFEVETITR